MAKFLNTSAVNYYLEELIKQTRERLIIISPFLKFNGCINLFTTKARRARNKRRSGKITTPFVFVSSLRLGGFA